MDEKEQDNTDGQSQNNPPTAPILDVQPSRPSVASEPGVSEPSPTDSMAGDVSPPPRFASQPDEPKVEDTDTPSSPTESGAPDPIKQPELPAPKKHKGPMLAIILAIVVAIALAVVAVMAFTKDDKGTSNNQPASSQQTAAVNPATVDATTKEIDDTVSSVDEAQDFPDSELSDQTLGL